MTKEIKKFTIVRSPDYGLIAHIYDANGDNWYPAEIPEDDAPYTFAGAEFEDCVIGGWKFPDEMNLDTPLKIAETLIRNGAVWDEKTQNEEAPEITAELSLLKPAATRTSPKKNRGPKR